MDNQILQETFQNMPNKNEVFVRTKNLIERVSLADILFIRQEARKIYLKTEYAEYWFYGKLLDFANSWPPYMFPCMKYTYINFDKVEKLRDHQIYFINGEIFNSIGLTNFLKTRKAFIEYLKAYSPTTRGPHTIRTLRKQDNPRISFSSKSKTKNNKKS